MTSSPPMAGAAAEGSRHRRIPPPVPPLRQVAHLRTPPPAVTTLTAAASPASSMRPTRTEAPQAGRRSLSVLSFVSSTLTHTSRASAQLRLFICILTSLISYSSTRFLFSLLSRVRSAPLKQSPGYQVDLVVQLVWVSGEPPQQITSLALNSSYGL